MDAAPLAVCAAITNASCEWKPISIPPCEAALIALKKNAVPQAHNAVAAPINSSFIWIVLPTELKITFANSTASLSFSSAQIQVIDS